MSLRESLRTPFRFKLLSKMISLVTLVALATGGLIGITLTNMSRNELRKNVLASSLAHADLAAQYASNYIKAVQSNMQSFAARPTTVHAARSDTPEQMQKEMSIFSKIQPAVDNISLYDAKGILRSTAFKKAQNIGASFKDREWYQQTMATGKPYLGIPIMSRVTGRSIVPYGLPILDGEGKICYILAGGISLAALSDAIVRIPVSPGARASLNDCRNGGIILVHEDTKRILTPISENNEVVRRLMAGERGTVETPSSTGELDLIAFTAVPDLPWGILVIQPSKLALASVNRMTTAAVIIIIITILLAMFIGSFMARKITRPLIRLSDASCDLAADDLTCRVQFLQKDEVGDLGRAFDQMAQIISDKDVQLRHSMSQLEASNKELEAFSYSVSHDLRAPLRHIMGFSELLQGTATTLDEKSKSYLKSILESVKRMGNLIDDLLSFSRMGRIEMQKSPVNTEQLIKAAINEFSNETKGRNITWNINPLPNVHGDSAMLQLVFTNLISNAIKFTRTRDQAKIEIGCALSENGETIFFIRDNGVGFDMKYVDQLFDVFQRLHSSHDFEGTGIGLANVKRIVQRHGGRVWAEGAVNDGATFNFSLPN